MHISPSIFRESHLVVSLTRDQRRALELVARHDGRYGRTRLACALAGEPDPCGRGLERAAQRGAVPSLRRSLAALDALCERGLIEVDASRGRELVLCVAPHGGRRVRRLKVVEQVRFDRLVARRNAMARERDALPSSIARLGELRRAACEVGAARESLSRHFSPRSWSRFGAVACELLAQAP